MRARAHHKNLKKKVHCENSDHFRDSSSVVVWNNRTSVRNNLWNMGVCAEEFAEHVWNKCGCVRNNLRNKLVYVRNFCGTNVSGAQALETAGKRGGGRGGGREGGEGRGVGHGRGGGGSAGMMRARARAHHKIF